MPVGTVREGAGIRARIGGQSLGKETDNRRHAMGQAKTLVKKTAHGSDRYNFMVFPDDGQWLWFVTFASMIPTAAPYWGRFLGCGAAPDEKEAWKQARSLAGRSRRRT
jgi:hypothetical protein